MKLRIDKILKQRGWSRNHLARRAKLDPRQVARWFKEDFDPRLSTLMRISNALQVNIRELFGR